MSSTETTTDKAENEAKEPTTRDLIERHIKKLCPLAAITDDALETGTRYEFALKGRTPDMIAKQIINGARAKNCQRPSIQFRLDETDGQCVAYIADPKAKKPPTNKDGGSEANDGKDASTGGNKPADDGKAAKQ